MRLRIIIVSKQRRCAAQLSGVLASVDEGLAPGVESGMTNQEQNEPRIETDEAWSLATTAVSDNAAKLQSIPSDPWPHIVRAPLH